MIKTVIARDGYTILDVSGLSPEVPRLVLIRHRTREVAAIVKNPDGRYHFVRLVKFGKLTRSNPKVLNTFSTLAEILNYKWLPDLVSECAMPRATVLALYPAEVVQKSLAQAVLEGLALLDN